MPVNEWRGDAPAFAQSITLISPNSTAPVEFFIGDRPLGWGQLWTTNGSGVWKSTEEIVALWNSSTLGEFKEVRATFNPLQADRIVLTAVEPGRPFAVSTSVGGLLTSSELQDIYIARATGGTFTLRFQGETTAAIDFDATAAEVQTALEGLAVIAPGDVVVTDIQAGWRVTFAGNYSALDVPQLVVDYSGLTGGTCSVSVTSIAEGVAPTNEVQIVSLPGGPTGGTFTLSLNGITTGNIAWNASASAVQTALRAVLGSNEVSCTGGALPGTAVTVTFQGDLGGQNLPLMVADGTNLTGASVAMSISTTTGGVVGTNAKHRFRINLAPTSPDYLGNTGLKFVLTVASSSGSLVFQTAELDYTATASQIQAALEAMKDVTNNVETSASYPFFGAGNVTVTGTLVNSWSSVWGAGQYLEIEFLGEWHSTRVNLTATRTSGNTQANFQQSVVSYGVPGTNEIQSLSQSGSPVGTFRLSFGGYSTDPIPYGATALAIEDALVRLPSIGQAGQHYTRPAAVVVNYFPNLHGSTFSTQASVRCAGGPLGSAPVTLTFASGGLQSTNVAQMTIDEGAASVSGSVNGDPGISEVQNVQISGGPWGGTFTLTYSGQTTGGIAWNAAPSEVLAALEALSNLAAGDLSVAVMSGGYRVAFAPALGNVPVMSGNGDGLRNGYVTVETIASGGASVLQITNRRSRGPWHFDDPYNWSLGRVPNTGDELRFQFGDTGPRWGIRQVAAFTVRAGDRSWLYCEGDFSNGQAIKLRTAGTLPSGLSASTVYYVRDFDPDVKRFRIATSVGGAFITPGNTGSGTHEAYVAIHGLKTWGTWRGWIGNTVIDADGGFRDYRPAYLAIGWDSGAKLTIGEGAGSSSPLVRIDSRDWAIAKTEILGSSGSKEADLAAVMLLGTNAGNSIELIDGDLGVALLRDEVSSLLNLVIRSGSCALGEGVTFAAGGSIDQTGGSPLRSRATLDGVLMVRG